MITIDIIGLIITICLIGIRYPHFVLTAAVVHDLGRILMAVFLHGNIDSIVAAGAFGSTAVSNFHGGLANFLIIFSGPLANYITSSIIGGVEWEKTSHLLDPCARLRHPIAVINLRLAFVSFLVNLWQLF